MSQLCFLSPPLRFIKHRYSYPSRNTDILRGPKSGRIHISCLGARCRRERMKWSGRECTILLTDPKRDPHAMVETPCDGFHVETARLERRSDTRGHGIAAFIGVYLAVVVRREIVETSTQYRIHSISQTPSRLLFPRKTRSIIIEKKKKPGSKTRRNKLTRE